MKPDTMERRRYMRGGLFARIEDVTFQVLRRAEGGGSREEDGVPSELAEGAEMAAVNMTFGPSECGRMGEPF